MPPPTLPPHLSHKVALVLLPPTTITAPIESIRRKHDKHYHRWPPHINLIYPFLASVSIPSTSPPNVVTAGSDHEDGSYVQSPHGRLDETVHARLRRALTGLKSFPVLLAKQPGHFQHNKRSSTVWLNPFSAQGEPSGAQRHASGGLETADEDAAASSAIHLVKELQARLQAEFAECDADDRPYTPHLSLGQAVGSDSAQTLGMEARDVIESFLGFRGQGDSEGSQEHEVKEVAADERQPRRSDGLEWLVDRVFVIDRKGFKDRFKIVGEVELGQG